MINPTFPGGSLSLLLPLWQSAPALTKRDRWSYDNESPQDIRPAYWFQCVTISENAETPSFWFMHSNFTFTKPTGNTIEEIKASFIDIAKKNPYGMVCAVRIMNGTKELRSVGESAHVDEHGNVDLTKWWDEVKKENCVLNFNNNQS